MQQLTKDMPVDVLDTDEKLESGSMKPNEINVYVAFTDKNGGKRPILVVSDKKISRILWNHKSI